MVLKLYTGKRYGVVDLVLTEKQVPYERVLVDMANRQHKTAEFLAMHPFGQVPVLDDDGFVLCELRAICRYIAEKYADQGTPLLPTDLKEKALFEQAASFEYTNFHPLVQKALSLYFFSKEWASILGFNRRGLTARWCYRGETTPEQLEAAVAAVAEKLAVYDVILGKQKFLAGNELTVADLFHLYYAPYFVDKEVDVMTSSGSNIARWWNELIQHPTWVKLKEMDAAGDK
ncbi:glutathione S-transferase [Mycena rebaudengoi]|nr:glutathione S-transferase [Mycena rebaudengoi]